MSAPLRVLKFGGTSLADGQARAAVLARISEAQGEGARVVAVVSAMGRMGAPYATDTLLSLAPQLDPRGRDLLMSCGEILSACVLASALCEAGLPTTPLSGADAGIVTDGVFGAASVCALRGTAIARVLEQGRIPVVTGFQGVGPDGAVTTLGRGGSDTSAVELAGLLGAHRADIFTDVPGFAQCDPRLVPQVKWHTALSGADAALLAQWGAGVVHPRAVEAGRRYGVPIFVRDTRTGGAGTEISDSVADGTGLVGLALLRGRALRDEPGPEALPFAGRWLHPGGDRSVVSVIFRPPGERVLARVAAEGAWTRCGPLLQRLVPDADGAHAAQRAYELLCKEE